MAVLCNRAGHIYFHPVVCSSLWSPYGTGQTIISLPCGFFLWPPCAANAYIIFCSVSIFWFYLVFQRSEIGCLPHHFHIWCGLSANLDCTFEMCCTRLAENTGHKKSPFCHHRTNLPGCIFATEAYVDNRKKYSLNTDTSSTCPHNMVNFGLLTR